MKKITYKISCQWVGGNGFYWLIEKEIVSPIFFGIFNKRITETYRKGTLDYAIEFVSKQEKIVHIVIDKTNL